MPIPLPDLDAYFSEPDSRKEFPSAMVNMRLSTLRTQCIDKLTTVASSPNNRPTAYKEDTWFESPATQALVTQIESLRKSIMQCIENRAKTWWEDCFVEEMKHYEKKWFHTYRFRHQIDRASAKARAIEQLVGKIREYRRMYEEYPLEQIAEAVGSMSETVLVDNVHLRFKEIYIRKTYGEEAAYHWLTHRGRVIPGSAGESFDESSYPSNRKSPSPEDKRRDDDYRRWSHLYHFLKDCEACRLPATQVVSIPMEWLRVLATYDSMDQTQASENKHIEYAKVWFEKKLHAFKKALETFHTNQKFAADETSEDKRIAKGIYGWPNDAVQGTSLETYCRHYIEFVDFYRFVQLFDDCLELAEPEVKLTVNQAPEITVR